MSVNFHTLQAKLLPVPLKLREALHYKHWQDVIHVFIRPSDHQASVCMMVVTSAINRLIRHHFDQSEVGSDSRMDMPEYLSMQKCISLAAGTALCRPLRSLNTGANLALGECSRSCMYFRVKLHKMHYTE